jgi:hypothetical protein
VVENYFGSHVNAGRSGKYALFILNVSYGRIILHAFRLEILEEQVLGKGGKRG